MLYCQSMHSARFGAAVRAVAWVLLAWVALDLGVPSLCALDREGQSTPLSSTAIYTPAGDNGMPDQSVHIDDCFCCSHCVNVASVSDIATPLLVDNRSLPPLTRSLFLAAYPPYHPPRA